MTMQRRIVVGLLVLALAAGAAELHVAPTGTDAGPGTPDRPFATVRNARDAIRALKQAGPLPAGGITVWVHGGRYPLRETLDFTAADSGTAAAPIVYRAAVGEDPWLSGGIQLPATGFTPVTAPDILQRLPETARSQVLQIDLRAAGVPADLDELPDAFSGFTRVEPLLLQLFCNGVWLTPARWPNEGFAIWDQIIDHGSGLVDYKAMRENRLRPGVFSYTGDEPARWNVDRGVWMMGFWARAYLCSAVRVGAIDPATRQITTKVPLTYGLDTWGAKRWYAFNLIEELDQPGEWFVDRANGLLYLWPPQPLADCRIAAAALTEPMLSLDGVAHVTFRGLGFEEGRADAIVVKGGRDLRFEACEVRNVGRHALQISGGTGHRVVGCDIHHVGASGVILNGGDRTTLAAADFEVANCHIHHTSLVKRTHSSPINLSGVGMRLANNLIHHAPHSAVFYGGNDLVMENNEIYWCHFETAEGGVFYCGYDWTFRGNVIRNNYIHHINDELAGSPTGVNVVHLDDCVAGTDFVSNIVYRVGRGVSMCGGPFNTVDNNLFIDCQVGAELSTRGLQWWEWTRQPDGTVTARDRRDSHAGMTCGLLTKLEKVPWNREPYSKYPHMAELLSVDEIGAPWWCAITRNISINGPVMQVDRRVKPEWAIIKDNWDGPSAGDPGVVAPYAADYRLKPDAPAAVTGFQPIALTEIGLRQDDRRRSWPVAAEPPPADWRPAWVRRRDMEKSMPMGLPVVAVRRASTAIQIDGTVAAAEWTPGEKETVEVNPYRPEPLVGTALGGKAVLPCRAWLQVDDSALYIGFENPLDAAAGSTGGHRWGQSDAVEIAMSVVAGQTPGPILIWRGYTDGHFETSDEAGAPQARVAAALQGVRYACNAAARDSWSAEFAIPFSAIGVEPRRRNPRILFNLSVRRVKGDQWITWKTAPGSTWDVRHGGILWLEPFGDVALNGAVPSRGTIHIMGRNSPTDTVLMQAGQGCQVAEWEKPVGCRITVETADLPADRWLPMEFTFTPQNDGVVQLMLMGRGQRSAIDNRLLPVWTYTDDLRAEGADVVNGGFEDPGPNGLPRGWQQGINPPLLVRSPGVAAEGEACVKTWHDGRLVQSLRVTAGRPVTVRCRVKGEVVTAPP